MATRWETFPVKFEGGWITNLGRLEQGINAPGSATILQNFEADVKGGYSRIQGFSKFIETAVPGTGQIKSVVTLSPSEVLVTRDSKVYYGTSAGWIDKLTLTSSAFIEANSETYNFAGTDITVSVDGVNDPYFFDHATKAVTAMSTPPTEVTGASVVKVFKNHVFYGKNNLLSFTEPYTDSGFNTGAGAGVINIGDAIVGLQVFRDELIIFCRNKIFRLSGNSSSDFVLSTITTNTGCLSGKTIQEVGGDIMYLGPDGVRYLSASERNNDFGLTRASSNIQEDLTANLSLNKRYVSVTLSKKSQYRLFIHSSNEFSQVSKGYLGVKFSDQSSTDISWSSLKGFKVYAVDKYQNFDTEVILFSSGTDYIYRMESGSSLDGEDIEAVFETPYIPITDIKIRKTFYKHTLYAKTQGLMNITVLPKFDYLQSNANSSEPFELSTQAGSAIYGSPLSVYGSAVYGALGQEQYYSNLVGSGFVIALRYSNTSQQPPFNINFAILEYRPNERV